MSYLNDLLIVNRKVIPKALGAFKKNPAILLVGMPYLLVALVVGRLALSLSFLGGILLYLMQAALISNYLHLIDRILVRGTFDLDDFKTGFTVYLRKVYILAFMVFVFNFGLGILARPLNFVHPLFGLLIPLANLLLIVLLNPLPEVIYQKYYSEWDSVVYSFRFIKTDWFNWLIPNALFGAIIYAVYRLIALWILPMVWGIPVGGYYLYLLVQSVILQVIVALMMIYRAFLFRELSTSSRRKRQFSRYFS